MLVDGRDREGSELSASAVLMSPAVDRCTLANCGRRRGGVVIPNIDSVTVRG